MSGETTALLVGVFTLGVLVRVGSRLRLGSWVASWVRRG